MISNGSGQTEKKLLWMNCNRLIRSIIKIPSFQQAALIRWYFLILFKM